MKRPELFKRRAAERWARLDTCRQLYAVAVWLAYMDQPLQAGIRSPEDAIKLYRAWLEGKILLTDKGEPVGTRSMIDVLGYDPKDV